MTTSPQRSARSTETVRTALVTGGNRGIGYEVCRQLGLAGARIVVGARDLALGNDAANELAKSRIDAIAIALDVASDASVDEAARTLREMKRDVDVLINNAGVYAHDSALGASLDEWRAVMETNFFGALRTAKAFMPNMIERGYGRVVNVSSGYGQLSEGLEGPAPYSVSKAALNALTMKLAEDARGDVKVNAVCPGWVRTRMGGAGATRPVEKGAETIVWLALLDESGPNGKLFRDKREIDW